MSTQEELASILKNYVGRESPLYHAERLSEYYRKCAVCLHLPGTDAWQNFHVPAHVGALAGQATGSSDLIVQREASLLPVLRKAIVPT